MLSAVQRWIVFAIFCAITLAAAGAEIYVIIGFVDKGLDLGKGIGALLGGGILAGCSYFFQKLIEANFLKGDRVPARRLHLLASERTKISQQNKEANLLDFANRRDLVTNTLKFAEETLRGWISGSHFELCVFVDAEMPLLFSYYDSNHHTHARTMTARQTSPKYYVEKGYEVTKLLANPSSRPKVIRDTESSPGYVFASDSQRQQLRSTMLMILDMEHPCALVVSSNSTKAFDESDEHLMSFLKFIGESVRNDLQYGDFIKRIRDLKPELFQQNLLAAPSNPPPIAVESGEAANAAV